MKFDTEAFFNKYIAPLIDNFYLKHPYAAGAPAIFVDNCPSTRRYGWKHADDIGWDYFTTDEEWFKGWQQVFRRIKSQYPNLKIMANWIPQNPEDGADRVFELVDHILFENFFGDIQLKFYLAYAYRAQKLGKGVTFGRTLWWTPNAQEPGKTEPTLDDYGRGYFCAFLLTWGENSHWNPQWHDTPHGTSGKIHDLPIFQKWFGVPSAGENGTDMWELRPNLWTRNFVNAKVFLNVSSYNTYTVPLSEAVDMDGSPILSITLGPGEGQFVFRQGAASETHPTTNKVSIQYAAYWKQLPTFWRGQQYYPYSISCDAIVNSLNIGVGQSNENWVAYSEDLEKWSPGDGTTIKKSIIWNGIQMYQIEEMPANPPSIYGPEIRHTINYGAFLPGASLAEKSLAGKYVTIICYAQQLDAGADGIQGISLAVDGAKNKKCTGNAIAVHPLKWGDYPQLIVSSIKIDAMDGEQHPNENNPSAWSCGIVIAGVPNTVMGKFAVGAVRVLISSESDNPAIGEYIRTTGSPLRRGNGAGIGLPLSLVSLSGYLPARGRPQLPLKNHTQIVRLASGGGRTASRPKLGVNDAGVQYFDTDVGKPLWWTGTQWRV